MTGSPKHSPWGSVSKSYRYAEGVFRVHTPGHGGLALTKSAAAGLSPAVLSKAINTGKWVFFEEDSAIGLVFEARPALFRAALEGAGAELSDDQLLEEVRWSNRRSFPELFGLPPRCKYCRGQHAPIPEGMLICFKTYSSWHKDVPEGFVGVAAAADWNRELHYFLIPADEYAEHVGGCFVVDPSRYQAIATLR